MIHLIHRLNQWYDHLQEPRRFGYFCLVIGPPLIIMNIGTARLGIGALWFFALALIRILG